MGKTASWAPARESTELISWHVISYLFNFYKQWCSERTSVLFTFKGALCCFGEEIQTPEFCHLQYWGGNNTNCVQGGQKFVYLVCWSASSPKTTHCSFNIRRPRDWTGAVSEEYNVVYVALDQAVINNNMYINKQIHSAAEFTQSFALPADALCEYSCVRSRSQLDRCSAWLFCQLSHQAKAMIINKH